MQHHHDRSFLKMLGSASSAGLRSLGSKLSPEQREILRADAERVQNQRSLRREFFEPRILGEPGWDILLALYVNDHERRRLSVRALAGVARVAATTALRAIAHLEELELIRRLPSTTDQRIVQIELSERGRASLDAYLMHIREAPSFGPMAD